MTKIEEFKKLAMPLAKQMKVLLDEYPDDEDEADVMEGESNSYQRFQQLKVSEAYDDLSIVYDELVRLCQPASYQGYLHKEEGRYYVGKTNHYITEGEDVEAYIFDHDQINYEWIEGTVVIDTDSGDYRLELFPDIPLEGVDVRIWEN